MNNGWYARADNLGVGNRNMIASQERQFTIGWGASHFCEATATMNARTTYRPLARAALLIAAFTQCSQFTIADSFFTGLGFFPGVTGGTQAFGVSDDGSVVVGYGHSVNSGSNFEAFRWTSSTGLQGLGDLPGGIFFSEGFGISGDGQVVVGSSNSSVPGREAFRWTATEGMVGLDDFPGGSNVSDANAASRDGAVIVGVGIAITGAMGFRWTATTGLESLGDLPGGTIASRADDVSADGSVITGTSVSSNGGEAFRWTAETGMVGVGDLPGGIFQSHADSISADGGTIVGDGWGLNGPEAFRWTASEGIVGLGNLPGGISSYATGVSGDGKTIVGGSQVPIPGAESAVWIWRQDLGIRELKPYLEEFGLAKSLRGWTLIEVNDISADGRTFVGWGFGPGGLGQEAWVATIPEPGTRLLSVVGCLFAWLGWDRFRRMAK